jgi:predicted NAD/FAD-binding protein
MRIAVIGAGISGCLAARLLATRHEVTLYEQDSQLGGHARTVEVPLGGVTHAVDVGFMVFNERTYPNFCRMLDLLGVESRPSDMSFSVNDPATGLEYQGSGLRGLFAQRRNALSPSFLRMIGDILRFNREARRAVASGAVREGATVGDFVRSGRFGVRFVKHYLTPMAAAIWSCKPQVILQFPAAFLLGFFANHGLLQIRDRPQWRTIVGGSRRYVAALLDGMQGNVRIGDPVTAVQRGAGNIEVHTETGAFEAFDEIVMATHADQTLRLLQNPTENERSLLEAFPYQANRAVLHTDATSLPTRIDAWASWNYRLTDDDSATVTYDLGRLQGFAAPGDLLLTLNDDRHIDQSKVIRSFEFTHPAYSGRSIDAQRRWSEISGRQGVHYCGAYWGYGFHEDGVKSALAVAKHFGIGIEACKAACTKERSPTPVAIR